MSRALRQRPDTPERGVRIENSSGTGARHLAVTLRVFGANPPEYPLGPQHSIDVLIKRNFTKTAVAAVAATAALVAAPAAVMSLGGALPADRVVVADGTPTGSGGPDGSGGGGGCSNGGNWQGCGGWNPATGGFGHGCFNGICGGWDGNRGWGG